MPPYFVLNTTLRASTAMALAIWSLPLAAQEAPSSSTPTPPAAEGVLPGVVPERFTLSPQKPTPTPEPTPQPQPSPKVERPAQPTPRATPTPTQAEQRPAPPKPLPIPTATVPAPLPQQAEAPPAPSITPSATPAVPPPTPRSDDMPAWLWALIGGGVVALGFGGYRRLGRNALDEAPLSEPGTIASPPPPILRKPPAPSPVEKPPVAPLSPQAPQEPFELQLRPQRLTVLAGEVILELELLLGNRQASSAENVRVQLTMLSANPDQDQHSAAYHAATMLGEGVVPPFDLAPGAGGRIPVRLSLPREALHVVELAKRPMFVPMVLVDLRWRSGISIRRLGADFLVGPAGQGDKVGPVWLDRPVAGPLASTRYVAKPLVAA